MAARAPTHEWLAGDRLRLSWETLTEADTATGYVLTRPVRSATVTMTGTWGGATLNLRGSPDGTTFINAVDRTGTDIALTADGGAEIADVAFLEVKPVASVAGTGRDVDIEMLLFLYPEHGR